MASTDVPAITTLKDDEKHAASVQVTDNDETCHDMALGSMTGDDMVHVFTWKGLTFGWIALVAVALMNYLDNVAVNTFQVYAISEYDRLSIEGALATAFSMVSIVMQAPLAVFSSHTSIFSIFAFSTLITTLGSVLQAATPNIGGFLFGTILNVIGTMTTRFVMLFSASSLSTMQYRGVALSCIGLPSVVSSLGGAPMAESALLNLGWRWGYGIWAILIPIISPSLLVVLFIYRRRKTNRLGRASGLRVKLLWPTLAQQDFIGIFLLVAGISLFLLPIPLEQGGVSAYGSARVATPTVIGFFVIVLFCLWEVRFAKNPLAPKHILANRTIIAVMGSNMFQYMSATLSSTYFYIALMVCSDLSISRATYIAYTTGITSQAIGVVYGLLMAWCKHMKWFYIGGVAIALLGRGLHYAFVDPEKQLVGIIVSQIIVGIGFANNVHALTIAQAATTSKDTPVLLALTFVLANVGGSIGGAVVGAVWTSVLPKKLRGALPATIKDQAMLIMNSLPVAQSFPLGSDERNAIKSAYMDTLRVILLISLVIQSLAFLVSLSIKNVSVEDSKVEESPSTYSREKETDS